VEVNGGRFREERVRVGRSLGHPAYVSGRNARGEGAYRGTSYERRETSYDGGDRSYERGDRSYERRERSYERRERSYERRERSYERRERSYERRETSYERGERSYERRETSYERGDTRHERREMTHEESAPSSTIVNAPVDSLNLLVTVVTRRAKVKGRPGVPPLVPPLEVPACASRAQGRRERA